MKLLLPTVVFNLASVHGQDFGGMNIGAAPENMEFFDSLAGFAGVDQLVLGVNVILFIRLLFFLNYVRSV